MMEGSTNAASNPDVANAALDSSLRDDTASSALNDGGSPPTRAASVSKNPSQRQTVTWGEKDPHSVSGVHSAAQPFNADEPNQSLSLSEKQNGGDSEDIFVRLGSAESRAQKTNPSNYVKLDDVLTVNPCESEAETLILKAIENQEGNDRAWANTGNTSLLENVPADAIKVFKSPPSEKQNGDDNESQSTTNIHHVGSADSRAAKKAKQKQQHIPKPKRIEKRNLTMEQTLATLTMTMAGFQDTDSDGNSRRQRGVDATVQSAAEGFALNANIVFRGNKHKAEHKTGNDVVACEVTTVGGGHCENMTKAPKNWGKLRNAVKASQGLQLSSSVEVHKKTDSAADQVGEGQEDVECGVPDDIDNIIQDSSGSAEEFGDAKRQGRKKLLRTTMVAPKGVVQDFQVFASERRGSFISYVRFLLLVVIPATAVAFILFYLTSEF